jgi:hypothetical protein
MEEAAAECREAFVSRNAEIYEVKEKLGLDYELDSLKDNRSIDLFMEEKVSPDGDTDKPEDLYMVLQVYRTLREEDRFAIDGTVEHIRVLNDNLTRLLEKISEEAGKRFRYLSGLLGPELLTEVAVEVENFWNLAQMPASSMKQLGRKYFRRAILQRHPLILNVSSRNKKKVLRKLCSKIATALKLDLFESEYEINLYEELEKFANLVEGGEGGNIKPLPVPSVRGKTRRGGLQVKKRRMDGTGAGEKLAFGTREESDISVDLDDPVE